MEARGLRPINVEECYQILAGSFGRGLLRSDRNKLGVAVAWNARTFKPLEYEITNEVQPTVSISYQIGDYQQSQEIHIDTTKTRFGAKPYLLCSCGHRGKLYLRPDGYFWACRSCQNLRYQLSYLNRKTFAGAGAYYLTRGFKLKMASAKLRRIYYAGQYTRRALAILKKSGKQFP